MKKIIYLVLILFIVSGCRSILISRTKQLKETEQLKETKQLKEIKPSEFYKDWENHLIDWKLKHPEVIPIETPPQIEEYYQEWEKNPKEGKVIKGGSGTTRPSLDSLFPSSVEPSLDYLFPSSVEP